MMLVQPIVGFLWLHYLANSWQFAGCQQICFTRTCTQVITGRGLRYKRALEIVQSEQYLEAADLDIIRKYYRVKRQINGYVTPSKQDVPFQTLVGANTTASPTPFLLYFNQSLPLYNQSLPLAGIAAGVAIGAIVSVAGLLTTSPAGAFPFLTSSLVPPGNPLPGTPFGGASPDQLLKLNSPNSEGATEEEFIDFAPEESNLAPPEVLSLVPPGLTPVAIFPPYATPRTVPAISVIFAENPSLAKLKRHKRKAKSSFDISSLWEDIQHLAANFKKNIKCLQTRLYMKFNAKKPRRKRLHGHDRFVVKSKEDCMEVVEEPLYGFSTKLMLLEDSPCSLNTTCLSSGLIQNRQTGEEFYSEAPPDCRLSLKSCD